VGDGTIKVYPVPTSLSRYLTSDADCVVEVLKPDLGEEDIRNAIARLIAKLNLRLKERIEIRVPRAAFAPEDAAQGTARVAVQQYWLRLGEALGFKKSSLTIK
jgi:hypothetical protein